MARERLGRVGWCGGRHGQVHEGRRLCSVSGTLEEAPTSTQTCPCSSRSWGMALAPMRFLRTSTSTPSTSPASSTGSRLSEVLPEARALSPTAPPPRRPNLKTCPTTALPSLLLVQPHVCLHLRADEDLDHAPRDALARRLTHRQARLAEVGAPLPHLVAGEGNQVERLRGTVRGLGRVVLDPHYGSGKPVVADHLGRQLLGGVGYRGALVGGQLRADDDRGVLVIFGEPDAHPAFTAPGVGM